MKDNIYTSVKFNPKSIKQIKEAVREYFPTDILDTFDRQRPYNGQPWTVEGQRGTTEVKGITERDIRDCFIRACYDSSGIEVKEYPKSVNDLPLNDMDMMAICQNMICWIERYMGIYPNTNPMIDTWEHIPIIEINEDEKK